MEDKGLPDFKNKVVVVYLANASRGCQDGIPIEYPHFEMRNGRVFLHGRIPEIRGEEWISNTKTGVLWDSVIHYLEYKSVEAYVSKLAEFKPTLLQRLTR